MAGVASCTHICPGGSYPLQREGVPAGRGVHRSYRVAKEGKRRNWANGRRLPVDRQEVVPTGFKGQKLLPGGLAHGGRRYMMGRLRYRKRCREGGV
ncbi:hypothetical protein MPNT_10011 [Candidatus Methylacidithermus pantelleriae]|uniref:Uncharacterized protein n=1 Tax=Candidatus Methylacidithermus pantelleriae TaxID=2744239 RepID=A0A8J2BIZ6_9BACT|nr:hypothetical protein MPNT_10011 [Candidatus Methylacidithermus pantelleriae]